jgi:hypothetical protein
MSLVVFRSAAGEIFMFAEQLSAFSKSSVSESARGVIT